MEGTQPAGAARFSCPPNFTAISPASEPPRLSLEALTGPDTELWLIQAPADFAPDSLNGRLVPLAGSQTVKGKLAGKRHRYRVLGSSGLQAGEATLLAPSAHAGGELTCAPAPQGSLRIFEGPQESLSRIPLQPIPASPPPQIPPGLRPRFRAFGGNPPVTGPGSTLALKSPALGKRKKKQQMPEALATPETVNGCGVLKGDTTLSSLEANVGKKKKKKQQLEAAEVTEPLGVPFPSPTRKRNKKPKGAEAVGPEVGVPEPEERTAELDLRVNTESPEDLVLPSSKKERQKRVEVGLVVAESQPQVKELQEETIPLPPMKKKKKKRQDAVVEPGTEGMEPVMRALALHQMTQPGLPGEAGPQPEAALLATKKRKKKEKRQNMLEPERPGDLEPQVAPASTKRKREGHTAMEPGTEMPEEPGEGEPEVRAAQGSTKKKKKQSQDSEMAELVPQEEVPVPLLNLESQEVAPTERWEKKRKRKPQQDPVASP